MEPTSSAGEPINPPDDPDQPAPRAATAQQPENWFKPVVSQTYTPTSTTPAPPPPYNPNDANSTPEQIPVAGPRTTNLPQSVVSGGPGAPLTAQPSSKRRLSKKAIIGLVTAFVVIGGAAIFYFGYFMNPSVIYSQGLSDTGKGYSRLVDFSDTQHKLTSQGYVGNGSYKVHYGDSSSEGSFNLKGDSGNGELTFDLGLGNGQINGDIRTLKNSTDTPDVYAKVSNIKGLGETFGFPDIDVTLAKIDGTWISVDHALLNGVGGLASVQSQANAAGTKGPTREQILDEARAFGRVNQQYVFSTQKDKAVTKVVKRYGKETIDGHKTYHYQVALQKDNVKKYIYAQRDALKQTSLNDWLKKNNYDKDTYADFDDAAKSANNIKSSDTFDIWVDTGKRIIYKIRLYDQKKPADNYVDIGLDYKGGDTYPLFVSGQTKDSGDTTVFKLVSAFDTTSNSTNFTADIKASGSDSWTATANFMLKPSNTKLKIDRPTNAKPLSQLLNELGYGDLIADYSGSSQDSERRSDIMSIQTQLEAFYQENGYYPNLADMNNPSWLSTHLKSLDQAALTDPSGSTQKLSAAPAAGIYSYQVTDSGGQSCEANDTNCARYTLTATLPDLPAGQNTYSKSNLD